LRESRGRPPTARSAQRAHSPRICSPSPPCALTADTGTTPAPPRRGHFVGGGSAGVAVGVEAGAAAARGSADGGAASFAPRAPPPEARWGMVGRGGRGWCGTPVEVVLCCLRPRPGEGAGVPPCQLCVCGGGRALPRNRTGEGDAADLGHLHWPEVRERKKRESAERVPPAPPPLPPPHPATPAPGTPTSLATHRALFFCTGPVGSLP